MALATQCPHCHTRFRVAADQLKLRGGIVRCGACQSIFDGNAHLVDLDAPGRKDAAPDAVSPAIPTAADTASADDVTDVVQFDPGAAELQTGPAPGHEPRSEPEPVAPEPVAPEPAVPEPAVPEPVSQDRSGRIEPSLALPPDGEPEPISTPAAHQPDAAAIPAAGAGDAPAPSPVRPAAHDDIPFTALPLRASAIGEPSRSSPVPSLPAAAAGSKRARAIEARAHRSKLTPTRIDAPKLRVPESDEPEFVKRSRRQERSGRTQRLLMGAGIAVLLLVLAGQALLNGRAVLAARYPALKPVLGGLCAVAGCRVGLPTQVENLAIETGELSPLGTGTYSLNTLLRNQGNLVQAWPSIELELVDDDDKPLLRRVFGPADYLPPAQAAAMQSAGFGGRSEQPVRIDFALAGITPAGYHLFVFYP